MERADTLSQGRSCYGFTLIELMIAIAIVGILVRIGLPAYTQYVIRASRQAAQSELLEMSNLEEKIYLNSNSYTTSVKTAYTGVATGGLGGTGSSRDGKYIYSISSSTSSNIDYTITATPVTSTQVNDGILSISSTGSRVWGSTSW